MKKYTLFMVTVGILLIMLPSVYSLGVTTPYWDTKPLNMVPGQSIEVELLLQNMVGGEDITLVGSVTQGADIATITDAHKEYKVPFGEKNVPVRVRVTLPASARVGDAPRIVGVSFKEVTQGGGNMLQLGTGVGSTFPVVVEAPQITGAAAAGGGVSGNLFVVVIALIAIALFMFLITKRRTRRIR